MTVTSTRRCHRCHVVLDAFEHLWCVVCAELNTRWGEPLVGPPSAPCPPPAPPRERAPSGPIPCTGPIPDDLRLPPPPRACRHAGL